jgi:flagellar P-ring protein precursor FlgI
MLARPKLCTAFLAAFICGGAVLTPALAPAARIKDVATLEGTAQEPLVGYGLVIGLSGTGDGQSAEFTINSLTALLDRLGVTVDPRDVRLKNVAAVLVTAQIDPGMAVGSKVAVTVSSVGDATSLEGGFLVMTPLKGTDGEIYLVAQGAVSIGGFNIRSGANNSYRKNHATVGRIPGGGLLKRQVRSDYLRGDQMAWLLHNPDFSTASAIADVVNAQYGAGTARATSAQRVLVRMPPAAVDQPIAFIAAVSELQTVTDTPARVVINERTGTIIVGAGVLLKEAAVAHGDLRVEIKTYYDASQPAPFARRGETVVTPDVNTAVSDNVAQVLRVPETSTVADVVNVLNEIGASPRDIIAILEALREAGALQAELVIF